MLTQGSLVPHPDLLHDPTRCGIALDMTGVDSDQAQTAECVIQYSACCFRAEALAPEWLTNPIAEFSLVTLYHAHEADRSEKRSIRSGCDGEGDTLVVIKSALVIRNPLLCDAVTIWMRDVQRRISYGANARQTLHVASGIWGPASDRSGSQRT